MKRRRCVLLFSRTPRREAASKGLPAEALFQLAQERVIDATRAVPGARLIVAGESLACVPRIPQRGGTFGQRLVNALEDVRALGFDDVVVVPGDVPELGRESLANAFAALSRRDVVLGPSPDGGLWLLGLSSGVPLTILIGIPWQTPETRSALHAAARAAGRRTALLTPLADVDDVDSFRALRGSRDPILRRLASRLGAARGGRPRTTHRGGDFLERVPTALRGPPHALAA